jgi:hypothetical protein
MKLVCVLAKGGPYRVEHVRRIVAQAERAGLTPVCLTDANGRTGAETIALNLGLRGWWAMLEMFRVPGPAIYMDLDTTIRGDISDLVRATDRLGPNEFLALYPWNQRARAKGEFATGVVAWSSDHSTLAQRISADVARGALRTIPGGLYGRMVRADRRRVYDNDQQYISQLWHEGGYRVRTIQNVCPGLVQSYKLDCGADLSNVTAPLLCYHGTPKPWDVEPVAGSEDVTT